MSYGIEFWGHAAKYLTNRIFTLQKKVVRIIANIAPYESCKATFKKLKILPLPALYISKTLIFVKQNPNLFSDNVSQHKYETRHKDLFNLEKHRTAGYEKGLFYSAQKYHNMLPKYIQEITCVKLFKKEIKNFLFAYNVYKIEDFENVNCI